MLSMINNPELPYPDSHNIGGDNSGIIVSDTFVDQLLYHPETYPVHFRSVTFSGAEDFSEDGLIKTGIPKYDFLDQATVDVRTKRSNEAASELEDTVDSRLIANFSSWVDSLKLNDLIVPANADKLPKGLEKYMLIPIERACGVDASIDETGCAVTYPQEGIRYNYREYGGRPYIDTSLAVGLVYKSEVVAVAAAGMSPSTGKLTIKQLQAVTLMANNKSTRLTSGLYGGFLWRDTLVNSWLEIAKKLGVRQINMQSNAKNKWQNAKESLWQYDEVAQRMGFEFDELSGDWKLTLVVES